MLIRWLGDVLSPPRCAACELAVPHDHVFCAACAPTVERCPARPRCPESARDRSDGELTAADVAFGYYGGALATAIRRLKYEDRPYLARPLGELLRGACRAANIGGGAVVPVPLHPRRLAERGYNQAALLAAHVAEELGAPLVTTALARQVDTAPQVKLSGADRQANLATAIQATSPASIRGRAVVLVDDVETTGATLRACRAVLLAAGARRVIAVVLARTPPGPAPDALGLDAGLVLDIGAPGPREFRMR